jgi:transcriptional regulator with XRE-family HTH domain
LGSPTYYAVRVILIEARRHAGLTQRQLATRLKRPHSWIAKIEAGARDLSVYEFCQISSALREVELTQASSAAVDLVQAGKLDEAERAARDLLMRFPDVHDGYDRLALVYEARGDRIKAAECYRKVIEFIRVDPDHHPSDFEAAVQRLIDKLDPPLKT